MTLVETCFWSLLHQKSLSAKTGRFYSVLPGKQGETPQCSLISIGDFPLGRTVAFADSWLSGLNEAAPTRGFCLPG
jgi:hypothetical protein